MTQAPASIFKMPTKSPQPARVSSRARKAAAARPKATGLAAGRVAGVETRAATRGDGEVIELDLGITVYPPRDKGGRWRAVWHEDGERQQCESVSEEKLAAKLEKVKQRLAMGASNMTRPGADLIAWYLNPDRLPVADRWSRKHADNQRRLCQRFAAPVISETSCQDITSSHTQKVVNAAPTAGEGDRVHRMLSAMVGAGLKGGESGVTALLELGTIDGLVYASTMVILHAVRHQLPVPRLARWMLALGITASLAGNVAQSLGVAAVVVPALALEYSPRLLQPEHDCSSSRHERRRPGRGAPREIRLIASNPVCRRKPVAWRRRSVSCRSG
jgi:hypothetical protein